VSLHQPLESSLAADIAFRFLQRLSLATAERLERLLAVPEPAADSHDGRPAVLPVATAEEESTDGLTERGELASMPDESRSSFGWLRVMLGWPAATVAPQHTLGEE
jgi:UDP-GlcNAc:undecaprenyl-phosphate GlcNAc-1-phosphate transferase